MKKLHLTLSGPIAAYNTTLKTNYRLTGEQATLSAVYGLIRCALGLKRGEPNPEISARILSSQHQDKFIDFQTVREAVRYNGGGGRNAVTYRYYLSESHSEVEVTGADVVIEEIRAALDYPKWQLYLGRRNCVPDRPILTGERLADKAGLLAEA